MPIQRVEFERGLVFGARYMALIAVVGSLAASVLMFAIGFTDVIKAYASWWPGVVRADGLSASSAAVISVIEALDRFLIAIVLLYFANGVYALFIRRDHQPDRIPLHQWLRVNSIGQLKQVVAEVIIVVLFVLFLRVALEVYGQADFEPTWNQLAFILVLPVATLMLAAALRIAALHPKPSGDGGGNGNSGTESGDHGERTAREPRSGRARDLEDEAETVEL